MEENKKWEKEDPPEKKKLCFCQIFFGGKNCEGEYFNTSFFLQRLAKNGE